MSWQRITKAWISTLSMIAILMLGISTVQAQDHAEPRVIGGDPVSSATTYPWMGLLEVNKDASRLRCGASFIGDEWVLTAAHCLVDQGWAAQASDVTLFVGQVDILEFRSGDEYTAAQIYVHPDYDPQSTINDIALIKLSNRYFGTTLSLANEVQAQQVLLIPQGLRILGWGQTSNSDNDKGSNTLQTALLNPIDCQTAWPNIPDSAFCALGAQIGTSGQYIDSCFGDSGGPVVSASDLIAPAVQVGIVSFGDKSCGINKPAVYTRITSYVDWINSTRNGESGESGGGVQPPPTDNNCQIGGGIECGPGEGGGSFPWWIVLFLPLIYVLRRRKHT